MSAESPFQIHTRPRSCGRAGSFRRTRRRKRKSPANWISQTLMGSVLGTTIGLAVLRKLEAVPSQLSPLVEFVEAWLRMG